MFKTAAGGALVAQASIARAQSRPKTAKKIVVAGAGISGLCCAYELSKRGHEVVVLEAAGRSGGHILTIRDRLADGLYADGGAEHFYPSAYAELYRYIEEFKLPVIPYPRRDSLLRFGALVLARDGREVVDTVNRLAPEHLHLITRDARALADRIDNAGAIFVGPHSPVAVGDYAAGPSHVLPTGGTARFASGLSANDFLRAGSVIHFTAGALATVRDDAVRIAQIEGLTAHAASVSVRKDHRTIGP